MGVEAGDAWAVGSVSSTLQVAGVNVQSHDSAVSGMATALGGGFRSSLCGSPTTYRVYFPTALQEPSRRPVEPALHSIGPAHHAGIGVENI